MPSFRLNPIGWKSGSRGRDVDSITRWEECQLSLCEMSRLDGICWGGHHWKTQSTIATQNLEAWNNISLSFSGFCLTGWSFFWSHLCNRILVILGSPQDWGHQSWDRRDVWASLSLFTACRSQGAFYKGKGRSYKPSWGADPRTHISFLPHWIGQSEIQSEPRFKKWRNRVCLMMRRAEYHGHLFSTSTHGLMATIIYILSTCRIYSIRAPPPAPTTSHLPLYP